MASQGKATTELMELIHGLIASDMRRALEAGSCEAKDWAVIVKFLKDNHIEIGVGDQTEDAEDAFNRLVKAAQSRIAQTTQDFQ